MSEYPPLPSQPEQGGIDTVEELAQADVDQQFAVIIENIALATPPEEQQEAATQERRSKFGGPADRHNGFGED